MRNRHGKTVVAVLLTAAVFFFMQGMATRAYAEGGAGWELWPRGRPVPGAEQPAPPPQAPAPTGKEAPAPAPPAEKAAEKAGEEAGKKVAAGVTAGTVVKWVLVLGGIAAIAVAAGGGGGGTTSNH